MTFWKNVIENSLFTIAYRNCNFQFITTKPSLEGSPFQYLFGKVVFNSVKTPILWKGQVEKIGLKREKDPISLGIEGGISPVCSLNIRTSPVHFSNDQFAPLVPKIGNISEKKNCILDQFHTVLSTFSLSLPNVLGQVRYFIIPPYQRRL